MYKIRNAKDFQRIFELPDGYKVDGLLCCGTWDTETQISIIKSILEDLKIDFKLNRFEGFLSNVVEFEIRDKKYWFTVMYGGALLSEMVHLACLFGSKKNIHVGSCGGLYPEISDSDIIIPTWSFGNESSTRAYDLDTKNHRHYPDEILSSELKDYLKDKYKIYSGPIITNQAMLGETWEDVKKWSEDGYYGVEMETATIFAVSKHFNVPSAAIVYVADNLIKGQSVGSESHTNQKKARELVRKDVYKSGLLSLIS